MPETDVQITPSGALQASSDFEPESPENEEQPALINVTAASDRCPTFIVSLPEHWLRQGSSRHLAKRESARQPQLPAWFGHHSPPRKVGSRAPVTVAEP